LAHDWRTPAELNCVTKGAAEFLFEMVRRQVAERLMESN
jgi:hypothetical protein